MVMSWDINAEWKYDPSIANEVEVRFIAESRERTRVELEHRKIERYGDKAEAMQGLRFPRRPGRPAARDGGTVKPLWLAAVDHGARRASARLAAAGSLLFERGGRAPRGAVARREALPGSAAEE